MEMKSTVERSIVGFAIGDALGVPYEFKKRGSFHCDDMRGSRLWDPHGLLPCGTWSDDTSLLLCVLDALQKSNKGAIYKRWRKNAIQWCLLGKFTNHGYRVPYDIGVSCRIGITCMMFHIKK